MGTLDALTKVAKKLHAKFGTEVTLRQVTTGAYDPAIGTAAETVTTVNISGVPAAYSDMEFGDTIKQGDLRLTIAGEDATPTMDDEVEFGGNRYEIVDIKVQYATDDVAYYELQLRR